MLNGLLFVLFIFLLNRNWRYTTLLPVDLELSDDAEYPKEMYFKG